MRNLLGLVVFLFVAVFPAAAQTRIAHDDAESYTNGFIGVNGGTDFSAAFVRSNLGNGGGFTVTSERRISGVRSFGVFAGTTGIGGAIARTIAARTALTRLEMRMRFDLNTSNGGFAGISINGGTAVSEDLWNPEQRLFVGLAGGGEWVVSTALGQNTTLGLSLIGGDVYRIMIDFNPSTTGPLAGRYRVQIVNETSGTRSALFEGVLGGTAGRSINSIGIANGVTGVNQDLIIDDIAIWSPATLTLSGPEGTVSAGSDVVMQAQTAGVTGLFGASLQLRYNPTQVTAATASAGALVSNPLFLQQALTNQLDLSVSARRPAANIAQDGTLASVTATLAPGLAPETVFSPFSVAGFDAVNAAGETIAMVPVVNPLTISPLPIPNISVSATSVAFGTVEVGQAPTRTVRVKNTGTANLVISNAAVTGPVFSVTPSTATIAMSDSADFTVTFTPAAETDYTDALVLTTNVTGLETVNVALSGSGQNPQPVVWPGDTDNNGTVQEADLLPIGTHYGVTGTSRPGGLLWQGRTVVRWSPEAATYADVNGDGVVNAMDVLGIGVNFGLSHSGGSGKTDVVEPLATLRIRSLPVGSRFTVTIDRAEASALMGVAAMLEADASLRPVSATGATLMSEQGLEFTLAQGGTLHAAYTRVRGEAPLQTSGAVMEATFEVIAPIASSAEVRLMRVSTSDPAGASVPGTFTLNSQVALNTEFGVGLPSELTLDGNAPNPAMSRTLLRVGIPESGATRLTVYDTLGREVHRETLGTLSAGWHLLPLDVSRLAPGLYVWRVEAGSHSQSRSLTVVR